MKLRIYIITLSYIRDIHVGMRLYYITFIRNVVLLDEQAYSSRCGVWGGFTVHREKEDVIVAWGSLWDVWDAVGFSRASGDKDHRDIGPKRFTVRGRGRR